MPGSGTAAMNQQNHEYSKKEPARLLFLFRHGNLINKIYRFVFNIKLYILKAGGYDVSIVIDFM